MRRRAVAVLAAAILVPGAIGGGSAVAQSFDLSDPPPTTTSRGSATTTTSTTPTATSTAPTTTTTPEITAADTPKGVLLDPADRVELATSLAEATEETGVCFGYEVSLGGTGADDQEEALSSFGPDRSIASASGLTDSSTFYSGDGASTDQTVTGDEYRRLCPRGALVLDVSLVYTSSSSESEDSANYSVRSSSDLALNGSPTARLRDLTGVDDGDLLGDDDDLALRNLAAALPLTLDDARPAPDTVTTASAQAPNGDRLTGSPGSDWIRAHGVGIAIAFALLLLGLLLVLGGRSGRKRSDPSTGPGGLDAGSGSSSTTTTP